jgi:hypothetical protein
LPAGLPPEDVLAAIHGSTGTVATGFHTTLAAAMSGRRWALLDTSGRGDLKPLADMLEQPDQYATTAPELAEAMRLGFPRQPDPHRYATLRTKADKHFDTVADEAERSWRANGGNSEHRWAEVRRENAQLRAAYRASRLRLAAERRKLLDHLPAVAAGAVSSIPAEDIEKLRADSVELERLLRTKLIRWSTPARRLYGRLK